MLNVLPGLDFFAVFSGAGGLAACLFSCAAEPRAKSTQAARPPAPLDTASYNVTMEVSRRQLAGTLAAIAATRIDAAAQTSAADADADLKAARDQIRANAEQLAKVKLPMAVEPAFRFRA